MKGDFTRFGIDARKHYSLVLHQQGRVTLDADSNEAAALLLRHIRALTRDLYGEAGGPPEGGFALAIDTGTSPPSLLVSPGHYYVDGILCENEDWVDYAQQPAWIPSPPVDDEGGDPLLAWLRQPSPDRPFWVYLDVWERHVSWIEDDAIREVALGGPDTCTRAQVVWQVKAVPWDREAWGDPNDNRDACGVPLPSLTRLGTARMAAQLDPRAAYSDPCIVSPGAAYRGTENHLYRVEVHRGGTAGAPGGASFKWSRENGSVATRWLGTDAEGDSAALVAASSRGLAAGDWVELSHDALDLANEPGTLVRLASIEGDHLVIDMASVPGGVLPAWSEALRHPKLRRWDQRGSDIVALDEGAVPVVESAGSPWTWLDLEDGLQVAFEAGGQYRSGDYWLIPARVATQGIEWPPRGTEGALQPPQGIVHAYAPLGVLGVDANGVPSLNRACRRCLALGQVDCVLPQPPAREQRALRPGVRRAAAPPRPAPAVAGATRHARRRSG